MMKTLLLALVLASAWSTAAAARCYSIWRYKTPQHCGVRLAALETRRQPQAGPARIREASAPVAAEERRWFVEITAMPEMTPQVMDEISHGVGIEKIRQLNQGSLSKEKQ